MQKVKHVLLLTSFMLLTSCGSGGSSGDDDTVVPGGDTGNNNQSNEFVAYSTPAGVEECSAEDIMRRVEFDMRDYYIYYADVPQVDLSDYETPEAYIQALRVEPDIYSSVRDATTQSTLFEAGETQNYGFSIGEAADGRVRLRTTPLGSSVNLAGVQRGDEFLEINGIPYDDITDEQWAEAFAREVGNTVDVLVRTGDEAPRLVEFEYRVYRWQTAGPAKRFSTPGNPTAGTIGYLPVYSFLETTRDDLDEAFNDLREGSPVEELILDLRYNTGGRIDVANDLGSVIGGSAVANDVSALYRHNDKYPGENFFTFFRSIPEALNLSRVIVLTTGRSASSSEIVINSLKPYIDVVVIGGQTEGKAFISSAREYCGKSINAMEAIGENAAGMSVVGGIEPTCVVEDDWGFPTDNQNDPLLNAGLTFALGESCGVLANNSSDLLRSATIGKDRKIRGDYPQTLWSDKK